MKHALTMAAAVLTLGCGLTTVCTLAACSSGLIVKILNPPAGSLTVQARVLNGASMYSAECPGADGCTDTVFFSDFTPDRVQITVTTTAGTHVQEVSPTYANVQPNGSHCAPTCRQATVTITWQ